MEVEPSPLVAPLTLAAFAAVLAPFAAVLAPFAAVSAVAVAAGDLVRLVPSLYYGGKGDRGVFCSCIELNEKRSSEKRRCGWMCCFLSFCRCGSVSFSNVY